MRLHPSSHIFSFSFCFQQSIRGILEKREKEKGEKRKTSHPFWKFMSLFPLVSNKWMIPYITIRRPAAAAAAVATTATGRKKRRRKDKKIAVAVQHPCQPRVDPPPALCLINPTYIARRDLSFLFSIDIINDVNNLILIISFIHLLL